ncbi:hypothetical protein [Flavobacterium soyae]|uniref:DUF7832 domain-containing protein n=1 Tax=Flavobacterium soyae TaxID=2903098 RepID=A0ABZ2UHA1_9FLAO
MTYDRIDWHSGNNFPKELPFENGGIHIGMFLTWIIDNDLIGLLHLENSKESIKKVKNREMTGTKFLIKECDSKFWSEDLNEEGNKFTNSYYANENDYGQYIDDYSEVFNHYKTLYHVDDNWENYNKIEPIITKRYSAWKNK